MAAKDWVATWMKKEGIGPEQKKLFERIENEIKDEEDAAHLNQLFDKIIEAAKGK